MATNPLQTASLPSLAQHQQSDTGLTSALASRYHAHLPIATLSTQGIVAINTCTDPGRGVDGGKEGSAHQAAEELSQRAYTRLGQRSEDQAVVFLYVMSIFKQPDRKANKVQGRVWLRQDDDPRTHAEDTSLVFLHASVEED